MRPGDGPDTENASWGTVGTGSRTVPQSCGQRPGSPSAGLPGSEWSFPTPQRPPQPWTGPHALSPGGFPARAPTPGPGSAVLSAGRRRSRVIRCIPGSVPTTLAGGGANSAVRPWPHGHRGRSYPRRQRGTERLRRTRPAHRERPCGHAQPSQPDAHQPSRPGVEGVSTKRHRTHPATSHPPLGQLKPEALISIKRSLKIRAELGLLYKETKTVQNEHRNGVSAAKSSVDKVNVGLSTSSKHSLCDGVQSPKKGA